MPPLWSCRPLLSSPRAFAPAINRPPACELIRERVIALAAKRSERIDADLFARRLLKRWGVVFRDVIARESLAPRWRDLLGALRRMEARGEIRGGRFIATIVGEQFALPDAIDALRAARRDGGGEELCAVSAYDPLHVVGAILPEANRPALIVAS